MPITITNNNSVVGVSQEVNTIQVGMSSAFDVSASAAEFAAQAEVSAELAELYAPAYYKDPSEFLASATVWPVGTRINARTGDVWDIVTSGTGNFDHPVSGIGVQSVKLVGSSIIYATMFGVRADGVTDDTDAAQACVDAAASWATANSGRGQPEIVWPAGEIVLSARGTVTNNAYDDGTGTIAAYNGSTAADITAETPTTLAYCVLVSADASIRHRGAGPNKTVFVGPWVAADGASSDYPAAFMHESGNVQWGAWVGLSFRGFFGCIWHPLGGHFIESEFRDLMFLNCAVPILTYKLERNNVDNIHFFGCSTGWVNGGQWRLRADNYREDGGWADKNLIGRVTGQTYTPYSNTLFAALDTWFDNNFFKTINNTTRKYPLGGSGTPATANKFRGISGRTFAWLSRYYRPNTSNRINLLTHMQSSRPPIAIDACNSLHIGTVYLEAVGYSSGGASGNIIDGSAAIDPWITTGRYIDPVFGYNCNSSGWTIDQIEAQYVAAQYANPLESHSYCRSVGAVYPVNGSYTYASTRGGRKSSALYVDLGTETVSGAKTWAADQTASGYRFGDVLANGVVRTCVDVGGVSTATLDLTLPQAGSYLMSVRSSVGGGFSASSWVTFLVVCSTFGSGGAQAIAALDGSTGTRPTGITCSDPTTGLALTLTSTRTGLDASHTFFVSIVRI